MEFSRGAARILKHLVREVDVSFYQASRRLSQRGPSSHRTDCGRLQRSNEKEEHLGT